MLRKSGSRLRKYELMLIGLCEVFDGLIMFLSFGTIYSNLSMASTSYFTKLYFKRKTNDRT